MSGQFKYSVFPVIAVMALAIGASAENRRGVAKVSTNPPGARVYIAGHEYGPTPIFIELTPGKHKMMVSLDGYPPQKKILSVLPGRVSYAKVKFAGGKPKEIRVHDTSKNGPDSGPGTVNVATDPSGLTIRMDDTVVPQTTPVSFDIAAGAYRMTVEQDGQKVLSRTVFVRAGRTLELDLEITRRRRIDEEDPWE